MKHQMRMLDRDLKDQNNLPNCQVRVAHSRRCFLAPAGLVVDMDPEAGKARILLKLRDVVQEMRRSSWV